MSSVSAITETIGDVVRGISDSVWPNVTVVSLHNFIWSVAIGVLLHADAVVSLIFVAEAAVWSAIIRRMDSLRVSVRVQISWHLEPVAPTIMPRLALGRRIITINSRST